MVNFTDLNFDVFLLILAFLSPSDARHLSMTCQTCHIIATPRALSVISIDSPDKARQIDGCSQYLLAGPPPQRVTHVRALRIPRSAPLVDVKHTSASQLMHILRAAHNLTEIVLAPSEAFLTVEPRLSLAFGALRNITDLTLSSVGQLSLALLEGMQSPVRKLSLQLEMAKLGVYTNAVLPALRPFRKSLEVLELKHVSSSESLRRDEDGEEGALCWPRVRELHLVNTHFPRTTLLNAFPNVRNLDLWLASLTPDDRAASDLPTHGGSSSSQVAGEPGFPPRRHATWETLEHVKMSNRLDLMNLGLRCPIRRISCPMLPLEECELLRNHSPRAVTLSMNHLVEAGPDAGIPFTVHEHALSILAYGEGGFDPLDSLWKVRIRTSDPDSLQSSSLNSPSAYCCMYVYRWTLARWASCTSTSTTAPDTQMKSASRSRGHSQSGTRRCASCSSHAARTRMGPACDGYR